MPMLTVNQREVKLTNLDRVLWPDAGLTKQDLIRYYIEAAPYLLPHLSGRLLVVQRFPDGIDGEGFYQKNTPEGAPEWLKTHSVMHQEGKETHYIIADSIEALVWLGNQACLELHPWLSSVSGLDLPDFAVFDLDPMENSTYEDVCRSALLIRELLDQQGLRCYPKLSGATGMQLYLPLKPLYSYAQARAFVEQNCRRAHTLLPEITTVERKIERRRGKLYLDYLQNVFGKTLAAVYSPRPLPGAPVSIPLEWTEVEAGFPGPGDFTITGVLPRLQEKGDLFLQALTDKQQIPQ
jgi:bifunctional non-homologous end joining protein LigD